MNSKRARVIRQHALSWCQTRGVQPQHQTRLLRMAKKHWKDHKSLPDMDELARVMVRRLRGSL